MAVSVDMTTTATTITWDPQDDDPRGHLVAAIRTGRLEDALTLLGGAPAVDDQGDAARLARSTMALVTDLERRLRVLAVHLRAEGMSWPQLANALYGDPARHSSARRVYEAGLRILGTQPDPADHS